MGNLKGGLYVKRLGEYKNLSQIQMTKIVEKRNEHISESESDKYSVQHVDFFLEMAEKLGVRNLKKILKSK